MSDESKLPEPAPADLTVPAPDRDSGVYGISVAAELVGMGAQNLRLYESRGLLEPERTHGGTRRYSANDLERLRRIGDLLSAGLNLAGIGMVMDLERENARLRDDRTGPVGTEATSDPPARAEGAGGAPSPGEQEDPAERRDQAHAVGDSTPGPHPPDRT